MHWIAALALAASLLAGCSKKEERPPPPAAEPAAGSLAAPAGPEITTAETLRRVADLADNICSCPNRGCAEALYAELQEENRRNAGRPRAKPTRADADALKAQAKRMSECLRQLPP